MATKNSQKKQWFFMNFTDFLYFHHKKYFA